MRFSLRHCLIVLRASDYFSLRLFTRAPSFQINGIQALRILQRKDSNLIVYLTYDLHFYLNINTRGQVQFHQRIDSRLRRFNYVNDPLVCPDLKLLP